MKRILQLRNVEPWQDDLCLSLIGESNYTCSLACPVFQVHARDRAATIAAATSTTSQVCLSHKILGSDAEHWHCVSQLWSGSLITTLPGTVHARPWFFKICCCIQVQIDPHASQTRSSSGVVQENSTGISRHAYMGCSARRSWFDIYGIVLPIGSVFTRKASSQFELDTGCRLLNETWPNKSRFNFNSFFNHVLFETS